MNRRNFISNLLTATAGFTILPSAGRLWVAKQEVLVPKFADYIDDRFHHRGSWGALMCMSDTVFTYHGDTGLHDITISVGNTLYGDYKAIQLKSGSVLAFHNHG